MQQRLADTLIARAEAPARLVAAREQSWASAMFAGARHTLTIEIGVAGCARMIDGLAEFEFALGEAFVADVGIIDRTDDRVDIELLVIDAG